MQNNNVRGCMEQKDNLAIVESVRIMEKILKKYGYNNVNAGNLNGMLQQLAKHGEIWYGAYLSKCKMNEDMLNYPPYRTEFDKYEAIEDFEENAMQTYINDYSMISAMAVAKTLVEKLQEKSETLSESISELLDKESNLSLFCENVLDSYTNAGISPFILESFALNQNDKYADSVKELKDVENKIAKLDKRHSTLLGDANKLGKAINTIETNTYLKYVDPEDNRTYVKHKYQVNVEKIQDKQDSKIKI